MIDIKELCKQAPPNANLNARDIKNLEELALAALLDPAESIKLGLVKELNRKMRNSLQGIYVADNQVFLKLQKDNYPKITLYVCDIPKTYQGKPVPKRISPIYRKRK